MKPPLLQIKIGSQARITAISLQHARAIWEQYRADKDLGASNAPKVLLYLDGVKIGHMSYNGRIWDLDNVEMEAAA